MSVDLSTQAHLQGKPAALVKMADVKLRVEQREFLAHANILAAHSPLLSELFEQFAEEVFTVVQLPGAGMEYGAVKKAPAELPVVVLGEDGPSKEAVQLPRLPMGEDVEASAGAQPTATSVISAAAFELLLAHIYHPYRVRSLSVENATLLVPAAHYLQCDDLRLACDNAIAATLHMSWDTPAPSYEHDFSYFIIDNEFYVAERLGEDFGKLDFAVRFDLPEVAFTALGSVLKKLTGRVDQLSQHNKKATILGALQYISTLPSAWRDLILQNMVLIDTSVSHTCQHCRRSCIAKPALDIGDVKKLMH